MNLVEIKHYLIQVKITSLSAMCSYFKCDADTLRCMMAHWVRKGSVKCFKKTAACGGSCLKCAPPVTEIYEWVM